MKLINKIEIYDYDKTDYMHVYLEEERVDE